jgi:hypothetical protein
MSLDLLFRPTFCFLFTLHHPSLYKKGGFPWWPKSGWMWQESIIAIQRFPPEEAFLSYLFFIGSLWCWCDSDRDTSRGILVYAQWENYHKSKIPVSETAGGGVSIPFHFYLEAAHLPSDTSEGEGMFLDQLETKCYWGSPLASCLITWGGPQVAFVSHPGNKTMSVLYDDRLKRRRNKKDQYCIHTLTTINSCLAILFRGRTHYFCSQKSAASG